MSIVTGRIVEIYAQEEMIMGKVNVRGAFMEVPLKFVPDAEVGDAIVIESGVAIGTKDPKLGSPS